MFQRRYLKMNSLKCEIEKCLLMKERDTIMPTVKCDNCGHSFEVRTEYKMR